MNRALSSLLVLIGVAACATPPQTPPPAPTAEGLVAPPVGACAPPEVRSIVYAAAPEFGALADGDPALAGLAWVSQSEPGAPEPWVVACLTAAQTSALEDRVMVEADPIMTAGIVAPALTPDDPNFPRQWPLPKIDAPRAWDVALGAGVLVAIVDTGVDPAHEDIGPLAWSKDLAGGGPYNPHGTHVAGIVAARINGVGGVGVAPSASLASCQALDKNGSGFTSNIASCITAAATGGAKVINLSLGGSSSSAALDSAVKGAIDAGVVVVAAAGNSNTSAPSYPGCSPGVIGIGATDENDRRASFSNFGACVDIAAPGTNYLSSVPGNGYASFSGTSMASPAAAGVVALALSVGVAPGAVLDHLRASADAGPADLGGKRVNALRAVLGGVPLPPPPATIAPNPGGPTPPPFPVTPPPAPGVCTRQIEPMLRTPSGGAWTPITVVVPCAQGERP